MTDVNTPFLRTGRGHHEEFKCFFGLCLHSRYFWLPDPPYPWQRLSIGQGSRCQISHGIGKNQCWQIQWVVYNHFMVFIRIILERSFRFQLIWTKETAKPASSLFTWICFSKRHLKGWHFFRSARMKNKQEVPTCTPYLHRTRIASF